MMKVIKNFFSKRSIPVMIVSLFLAVLLWCYITGVENPEIDSTITDVNITYLGTDLLNDRDLMVVEAALNNIEVTVRGTRTDILSLNKESIVASVDLSYITAGGDFSPVIDVEVPSTVTLVSQSSNRLSVKVEKVITESISVNATLDSTSTIAEGSMIGEITASPEKITVTGPESIVSTIKEATVSIHRENISSTIDTEETYNLVDNSGKVVSSNLITTDADKIQVTVNVLAIKTVELKVEFIDGGGATSSNVRCEIEPASITVSGDPKTLESLNQITIGTVDLAQVYSSSTENMDITLPNGITSVSGETNASVNISITGLKTKVLKVTNIQLINISEGYKAELLTQQLEITIRGTSTDVEAITANNIEVIVDLNNEELPEGQQTVNATVTIDGYTDVGILGTDVKVNVEITED